MAKTTIIYSSKNTFVCSTYKTLNFGKDCNLLITANSKILIYFDLSSIPPNATITSAKLHLYLYNSYPYNTIVNIKKLDSTFYKYTVTYDTAPASSILDWKDINIKEITPLHVNKFVTFTNLTNTVSSWHRGFVPNYGFQLSSSENFLLSFFSSECSFSNLSPNLEVEYTVSSNPINTIETTIITEMICQSKAVIESSVSNISNSIFFNYFIDNSLIGLNDMPPEFVYVGIQSCSTINGTFENIGSLISIAPGTNKSIEVSGVNNYIRLSINGCIGSRISIYAIFKHFANPKISSISSCKIVGDDLILTMTNPPANITPNITDFTITHPKDFDYLPEIKVIKTLVYDTTAILTCSDNALFFFGTTLSYTATGKNDMPGINGDADVLNFTNQPLILDTPIVIAPAQKITLTTEPIQSTIYFVPKEMTFKYSLHLDLKSNSTILVTTQGCDKNSSDFFDISQDISIVSPITVLPIIPHTYARVRLSVKRSANLNSTDEIDILEIVPVYTASYDYIPAVPLSGKVISQGNQILLTMSKPLTTIDTIPLSSENVFTISTSLGENLTFTNITVLATSVTLSLNKTLILASKSTDYIYITYIYNGFYVLTDSNALVDNFINFKIELYMESVNIKNKITPLSIDTKTTIEDISEFLSLKYIVDNTSSNIVLAKLQSSATRAGTFVTIDDESLILPNSSLDIPVYSAEKYVRLSVRKYEDTIIDESIDVITSYTNYTDNIPSIPNKVSGSLAENNSKIIFTMTKSLIDILTTDISISIFTVNTSLKTEIIVSKLTVLDKKVTLTLKEPIKITITAEDYIALSYTSTDEINYLTGKNGNVQDFADFKIETSIETVSIEEFYSLSTTSTKTTIYNTSRAHTFNYIINTAQCLSDTVVTPMQCDFRNGQFEAIPNMSVILPANSLKTIILLPTKTYVSLLLNHEVDSTKFIFATTQYTCFSDMVPAKVISGKVIEKGTQMVLKMSKPLTTLTVASPVDGIFNITTSLGNPVIIDNVSVIVTTVTLTLNEAITTSDFLYLDYTATDTTNYLTDKNGNIDNFAYCKIDIYVETVKIEQIIIPQTSYIYSTIYDARKAVTFKYIVNNTSSINTVYVMLNKSTNRTGPFEPTLEVPLSIAPNTTLEIPVLETNFYVCSSVKTDTAALDTKGINITAHYEASPHKIPAMPKCGFMTHDSLYFQEGPCQIILKFTKPLGSDIDYFNIISAFAITELDNLITFEPDLVTYNIDLHITYTDVLDIYLPDLKKMYKSSTEFLITYKGDEVNKITGPTGDLDNFTDFKVYCLSDSAKCRNN